MAVGSAGRLGCAARGLSELINECNTIGDM